MPYRFALLAFVVAAPALAQTVPTSSEEPTTIDAERIEGVGELEVTARGNAEIRQGDFSVFGEVLPMTLAVEHPRRFSSWVGRPVGWLSVILTPVRLALGGLTALTLRLVGSERGPSEPEITEEELERTPSTEPAFATLQGQLSGSLFPAVPELDRGPCDTVPLNDTSPDHD